MLRTKCIFLPPSKGDGLRVSIMSRHTLSDGITPDERITAWSYDLWLRDLAPPSRIVGSYYREEISFGQYCVMYCAYLRDDVRSAIVQTIAQYARRKRITLLCSEMVSTMCHRSILLDECVRYESDLHIQHF